MNATVETTPITIDMDHQNHALLNVQETHLINVVAVNQFMSYLQNA